ncbi:unnamed protein product, partial [Musa acuminata var. zebrina]
LLPWSFVSTLKSPTRQQTQRAGIEGPGLISLEGLKKFFGRQLKRLCSLQHR